MGEGHPVMLGTRNTSKEEVVKFKEVNPAVAIGNFLEKAQFGDLLVLATGGLVTEEAIKLAGTNNFSGKKLLTQPTR